jgi:hypothetical protein
VYPWNIAKGQDSGVVITKYNPESQDVILTVFGFSGQATQVLGRHLFDRGKFWSPYCDVGGYQIGIYICQISYNPKLPSVKERLESAEMEVTRLQESLLKSRCS